MTIDEVQKVPALMDVAQELIDRGEAQFVFTGSSARKLRRGRDLNLLPGRLVALRLDPLTIEENAPKDLNEALLFGSLPAICRLQDRDDREADLRSYVETYLEEEIRQEALVRNVGRFGRFVELAGQESGHIANYTKISQDVGVSAVSGRAYYEILCDCLVAERVEPIARSTSRQRLTRASRYLHFDLDWVLEHERTFVPIEVKRTDRPGARDARHIGVLLEEYKAKRGFVICAAPRPLRLGPGVTAIPWQELPDVVAALAGRRQNL